ncbi:hypothetical protein ACWC2K_27220 [Streptomyces chattanoogensis]|uniref:hypothetical protein n=1 Tax=Streptomyces chattanoogensis TaxID=66876 RepID=UPI00368602A1
MLHRAGDREEARNRLAGLWQEIGPEGGAFHRCALAHYMADTQDDPRDELAWDLRALEAAEGSVEHGGEGRAERRVTEPAEGADAEALRAFFPSLHLNLAADYVTLGRPADARAQLLRARASADGLADGEYRQGLKEAIDRLAVRLDGDGQRPRG